MRGAEHDIVAGKSRVRAVAPILMLSLLLSAGGLGVADAKTKKQCEKDLKTGVGRCIELPKPEQCNDQAWRQYNKCRCGATGGVYSESLGSPHCTGGTETYSVGPSNVPRRPKGPLQATPQPLSDPPTPMRPKGPGSAGTPPKSNPTPPMKPPSPGNVTAPKSNPPSGGGPILRSGNSGGSKR